MDGLECAVLRIGTDYLASAVCEVVHWIAVKMSKQSICLSFCCFRDKRLDAQHFKFEREPEAVACKYISVLRYTSCHCQVSNVKVKCQGQIVVEIRALITHLNKKQR